jgi:hypothetical protein
MATPTIYNVKSLADGQLPNTKTTLYTVPASTEATFKAIFILNEGAGANTANIYLKRSGGSSRKIWSRAMATGDYTTISDFTLATGDIIEGDATNATEVTYIITGALGS